MKKEIRSFTKEGAPKIVENRTIEGYAVVFNRESRILFDWEKRQFFKEIILPGAISSDLLKESDVKALLEHDSSRLLARSFKGVGTLTLEIDEIGLKYRFIAPNTADGDYAVEMISRGDIFGSSFCYTANETEDVSYKRDGENCVIRSVKRIDGLYDVSPVSDPAYFQTNVSVRSIQEALGESPSSRAESKEYLEEVKLLRSIANE